MFIHNIQKCLFLWYNEKIKRLTKYSVNVIYLTKQHGTYYVPPTFIILFCHVCRINNIWIIVMSFIFFVNFTLDPYNIWYFSSCVLCKCVLACAWHVYISCNKILNWFWILSFCNCIMSKQRMNLNTFVQDFTRSPNKYFVSIIHVPQSKWVIHLKSCTFLLYA